MQLRLDQHSPIYQQIIDEFKRAIARGELKPGDRIPSQRELASMVQVNPNTVQRAYREMGQLGITETLRGQGTFVTQDAGLVDSVRREMAERALVSFVAGDERPGLRVRRDGGAGAGDVPPGARGAGG